MIKFLPIALVCYFCLVAFILIDVGEAGESKVLVRNRRYLTFLNNSKLYLKFNFKANIIPWNQLFAQAIGFRMNWNDPHDRFFLHQRIYRRHVYDYAETLLDRNGLSGYHCVRRAICEMQMMPQPNNVYHTLLKMVFRRISSSTERWHNTTDEECDMSLSHCPFSFLHVSPYTDIN